jgi:hypothetical protein
LKTFGGRSSTSSLKKWLIVATVITRRCIHTVAISNVHKKILAAISSQSVLLRVDIRVISLSILAKITLPLSLMLCPTFKTLLKLLSAPWPARILGRGINGQENKYAHCSFGFPLPLCYQGFNPSVLRLSA